jgi:hypothetical protein
MQKRPERVGGIPEVGDARHAAALAQGSGLSTSSLVFRSHLLLDLRWAWGSFGFITKHQSTTKAFGVEG